MISLAPEKGDRDMNSYTRAQMRSEEEVLR